MTCHKVTATVVTATVVTATRENDIFPKHSVTHPDNVLIITMFHNPSRYMCHIFWRNSQTRVLLKGILTIYKLRTSTVILMFYCTVDTKLIIYYFSGRNKLTHIYIIDVT